MSHLVVLTGAGVSAESGIRTFRDGDGLWENHRIEDVATPEAWHRDPETVLAFYDERRRQVRAAQPNAAHMALAALENEGFRVSIVTQNIDDLHERAGSRSVLHLHGEILKARSSADPRLIYRLADDEDIRPGDHCDRGSQLRPHVVWFGETVPLYGTACDVVADADLVLVVGTSLAVAPASALVNEAEWHVPRILVDPAAEEVAPRGVTTMATSATEGVSRLADYWRQHRRLELPDFLAD
ncbi:SIR2 family NAD-dependent protein deacylase [Kushneria phosphatilytica]|uniref:NAD-dependent protein deacylase n=1 Tax=Kushneria phosphatilytica TaxID=657387 RepID=A0A1S1NRS6_9GAMM|nr:Sir2 family NAD-dependent protein deacetylase [Kushneria phosphatilytica]OHV07764.1 NAD-dependent deacylase [Kushneria phosphatilytica]QEL10267.1 NAD-dependent deacylase [Kushneria phosphatilytica]